VAFGFVRNLARSSLIRTTLVYGLTNGLNRAIPFLMVPVFSRILSPADYGIVAMFGVIVTIVSVFLGFGSLSAISLKYFDRGQIDLPAYVGNCVFLFVVSLVVLAVALFAFSGPLERATDVPHEWSWWALEVAATTFLANVLLYLWQAEQRSVAYGAFQVIQTIVNLGLSAWFVIVLRMGWRGRVDAQIVTATLFAIVALIILVRSGRIRASVRSDYLKSALNLGLPLIPHALGGFIMDTTDRILITHMVSVEDTGIYSVGSQVGMAVVLVTGSFNTAWVPWLFERLKWNDEQIKRRIVVFTYLYAFALIVLALSIALISPWFFSFFVGKSFMSGFKYVLWVALGYAFNGMYMMVTNYIFFVEKTYLLAWITFTSAIINVVASYFLIKLHGAVGAAQATMLAHLCMFLMTWAVSARVYSMPWSLRRKT
jgi:O-antigen/teichoic acid export membrane protein